MPQLCWARAQIDPLTLKYRPDFLCLLFKDAIQVYCGADLIDVRSLHIATTQSGPSIEIEALCVAEPN